MREIKFRAWDKQTRSMITNSTRTMTLHGGFDDNNPMFTLMQYTGMLDKKGVEIYEGDIVQYMYRSWNTAGMGDRLERKVVEFKDGSFDCYSEDSFGNEVIGNIYENPELLETT